MKSIGYIEPRTHYVGNWSPRVCYGLFLGPEDQPLGLGGKGTIYIHTGGCQNYGPFLGTLNIGCRTIIGIQKGTIILTTTQYR